MSIPQLPPQPTSPPQNLSVLFICLGNICRSPMAEGVFLSQTSSPSALSFSRIDSAGTAGYHIGSSPDRRTLNVLEKHNVLKGYRHSARQIAPRDFLDFDWIFAMDVDNLEDLLDMRERAKRSLQKGDGGDGPKRKGLRGAVEDLEGAEEDQAAARDTGNKAADGLAHVYMYGQFGGKSQDEEVGDPYYGGKNGFDIAFEQLSRFGEGFLEYLGGGKNVVGSSSKGKGETQKKQGKDGSGSEL